MKPNSTLRIAVLISGGGTTLLNLLKKKERGELPVEFGLVVSSSRSAGGVKIAQENQIPVHHAIRSHSPDDQSYSESVFAAIREREIDLVVMGGFLKHVLIPDDFTNRVINIHPSLIPSFSGQGFYGINVHRAVIEKGCKISGCTVHFVDNVYDHGPIIDQQTVRVEDHFDAEALREAVFQSECEALPNVIKMIAEGRVSVESNRVRIQPGN